MHHSNLIYSHTHMGGQQSVSAFRYRTMVWELESCFKWFQLWQRGVNKILLKFNWAMRSIKMYQAWNTTELMCESAAAWGAMDLMIYVLKAWNVAPFKWMPTYYTTYRSNCAFQGIILLEEKMRWFHNCSTVSLLFLWAVSSIRSPASPKVFRSFPFNNIKSNQLISTCL